MDGWNRLTCTSVRYFTANSRRPLIIKSRGEIFGLWNSVAEDSHLLGCDSVSSGKQFPTFCIRQSLRPRVQRVREECLAPEEENSTILRQAKDSTTVQRHIPPEANLSKVAVKRLAGCLHLFRMRSRVQTSGRMTVNLRTSRFSWVPPYKLRDSALK
jgi:hypothetical protein